METSSDPIKKFMTENSKKSATKFLICYGDWGKDTNLKNQSPSPGNKLRNKIGKAVNIDIASAREPFTSQTCFACFTGKVGYKPLTNRRSEKNKHNKKYTKPFSVVKHHLLLCSNKDCRRLWHRDTMAQLNIGYKKIVSLFEKGLVEAASLTTSLTNDPQGWQNVHTEWGIFTSVPEKGTKKS
jgi:hypothetical protein